MGTRTAGSLAAVAIFGIAVAGGGDAPPSDAEILRERDGLRVAVMRPDAPGRYHTGTRFAAVAAVLRAELDGVPYLYAPEGHNPLDDHAGLAAEFDLCVPGGPPDDFPPGYRDAPVGGGFLKIGVGWLEKKAAPYSLFQHNRVLTPAETSVREDADGVHFRQVCAPNADYAYILEATVRLEPSAVAVDWTLANVGRKAWTTRQYTHNFFRLADRPSGEGQRLTFPYPIQPAGLEPEQRFDPPDTIVFARPVPRWANLVVPWPDGYAGANRLTLTDPVAGRAVVCEVSRPGSHTAVHARPDYIAPEQFIELRVEPGDRERWRRVYTFVAPASLAPTKEKTP